MLANLRALWGIPRLFSPPFPASRRLSSSPLRPSEPCALSFLPLWVAAARQARQVS